MYTPPAFAVDDPRAVLSDLLVDHAATLVSTGADGQRVTVLPLLVEEDAGGGLVLRGHLARANPHATVADGTPTVATVVGPQGYVTPSWYPSKAEHGRVVPTWDYVAAVATGLLRTIDDPDWLVALVTRLTERHEAGRSRPWAVSDAPEDFVARQARAIVGVELAVERLEAKVKLGQNKAGADQAGVVAGLRAERPPSDPLTAAVEAAVSGADGGRR
ncbi:MAG TPA: FMN-binding negative transcriptional regulator [Iamia sp.]|nr:FMN-binding negative transcriptional regulator [Iamia sp.]